MIRNPNGSTTETEHGTALHLTPGGGRAETPSSQAVDVYNQTIDGEIAASVTAASGGTNTSGPKVLTAGFSFGQSAKARGIGYQEEMSPTIRGGEGGNQKPHILIHEIE